MRVLVTGASGFIGSALCTALGRAGHRVVACAHRNRPARLPGDPEILAIDYTCDTQPCAWEPRLAGVEVVINAVGILRESRSLSFADLHDRAPRALFAACEQAVVKRVIQISALGADACASTQYHLSKKAADDRLRASSLDWTIVQPSLVFGPTGASSRLLLALASLPVIPLAGRGDQCLQPIHLDDLATLVLHLSTERVGIHETIEAVGNEAVTFKELLRAYRQALGLGPARFLSVPMTFMGVAGRVGDITRHAVLGSETLAMLQRGNIGSPLRLARILRRPPRALAEFIPAGQATAARCSALASWLRPLLRVTLAVMWIAAGMVSAVFAQDTGLALLGTLGLTPLLAETGFAAACTLNVALGLATLVRPGPRLWLAQLLVMLFYTGALSWVAPELWADPFGALVKNIPLAAVLVALWSTENENPAWTTD